MANFMTTGGFIDLVWCSECERQVVVRKDEDGIYCCARCGETVQNVEGTSYDDEPNGLDETMAGYRQHIAPRKDVDGTY